MADGGGIKRSDLLTGREGCGCPSCGGPTTVMDSRPVRQFAAIRRRRRCLGCSFRFTTWEMIGGTADPRKLVHIKESISAMREALDEMEGIVDGLAPAAQEC